MTESLDPQNRRAYRRRAAPMVLLGALLLLVGLRGYLIPATVEDTAAHEALGTLTYAVWHAGLTVSGLVILIGLLSLRPEVEVLGLWAGVWALGVHGAALALTFGWASTTTAGLVLLAIWVLLVRSSDLRAFASRDRRRIRRHVPVERRR